MTAITPALVHLIEADDQVPRQLSDWLTAAGIDLQSIASHHAELQARFATLTRRERQVMVLVTAGKLNKQVGGDLGLSEITVKAHRAMAMKKMRARSLADLVRMADAIGAEYTIA